MKVEIFNLTSGLKETIFLLQHKSCECKRRLNESVRNSKQKWNHYKCWVSVKVNNSMLGVLIMITYQVLVHVIVSVIRHVKLSNISALKIGHAKNVFGKLVLACEDECN